LQLFTRNNLDKREVDWCWILSFLEGLGFLRINQLTKQM